MGLDPQESLIKVNKNSYMSYGIKIKKATKKVGGTEG